MTASELIKELSKYDPDTEIMVSGYEGGYNIANRVFLRDSVYSEYNAKQWYYGDYALVADNVVNYEKFSKRAERLIIGAYE